MAKRRQPEKALQQEIKRTLAALGFEVTDFSQPRATMQTPGIPDLYVRHRGWKIRVWLEVKTNKGKQTPAQVQWQACEMESGGRCYVVRSADDAVTAMIECGAPIIKEGISYRRPTNKEGEQ